MKAIVQEHLCNLCNLRNLWTDPHGSERVTERGRVKKLHWLPYQRAIMDDPARYVLVEKSRRIGFDYALAYAATMRRLQGHRRDLWYTSADESAAAEFVEYCRAFAERVQAVLEHFIEDLEEAEDSRGRIKTFCLRFPNGSRINALSSSTRRLRSKGGDVAISEFAFHDDPAALYAAAQPATAWGDHLIIGSTHNGEGSLFNRFCQDACRMENTGGRPGTPWSRHRITIASAVAQGLVELINLERETTFTREQYLADLRAGCATEDHWLQEYMCQPSSETTAWLPYDLIRTCEHEDCPAIGAPLRTVPGDEVRTAGIDVGRKQDLTVLMILGQVGDVQWTRRIVALEKTPIPGGPGGRPCWDDYGGLDQPGRLLIGRSHGGAD